MTRDVEFIFKEGIEENIFPDGSDEGVIISESGFTIKDADAYEVENGTIKIHRDRIIYIYQLSDFYRVKILPS